MDKVFTSKEQDQISKANYAKAVAYFKSIGQWEKGMVLHHIDPSIRHTDIEHYILWLVDELVPMTRSEHNRIHRLGVKVSDETRANMSRAQKGKYVSPETKAKISESVTIAMQAEEVKKKMRDAKLGTTKPEEFKQFMSEIMSKKLWWNNGFKNVRAEVCPEGFVPGQLRKTKEN